MCEDPLARRSALYLGGYWYRLILTRGDPLTTSRSGYRNFTSAAKSMTAKSQRHDKKSRLAVLASARMAQPLRRRSGNQHLHRESQKDRDGVKRKIHAYHVFMQAGVISQGLLQYLAAVAPTQVWNSFGSWLRTIRPGVAPSEFVVARALRHTLPLNNHEQTSIAKFIGENQNLDTMEMFGVAA
jgi:hypothetical protein